MKKKKKKVKLPVLYFTLEFKMFVNKFVLSKVKLRRKIQVAYNCELFFAVRQTQKK